MKPDRKTDSALFNKFRLKCSTRSLASTLALSNMKCNLPFSLKQKPTETITMERLRTQQSRLKTGLLPTAVNYSLVKINDFQTRVTSALWSTMSEVLCFNANFNQDWTTSTSSKKFCMVYTVYGIMQLAQDSINKATLCECW